MQILLSADSTDGKAWKHFIEAYSRKNNKHLSTRLFDLHNRQGSRENLSNPYYLYAYNPTFNITVPKLYSVTSVIDTQSQDRKYFSEILLNNKWCQNSAKWAISILGEATALGWPANQKSATIETWSTDKLQSFLPSQYAHKSKEKRVDMTVEK